MPTYQHIYTEHAYPLNAVFDYYPLNAVLDYYRIFVTSLPSHILHGTATDLRSIILSTPKARPLFRARPFRIADFVPHPGYFIAGIIAGSISRTATAPLDLLKTYFIANTTSRSNLSIDLVKAENLRCSQRRLNLPTVNAIKYLWRLGGLRGFYAGM